MVTAKDEQTASQWIGIAVEIRGRCLSCGNPLMVNAAVKELTCPSCLGTVALPRGDWMSVLERIVKDGAHGLGASDVSMPLGQLAEPSIRWFPQAPPCGKCKEPLELGGALARGVGGSIACARCGEKVLLRSLQPDLTGMSVLAVGEDPDQLPSGIDGPMPPAAAEPVRFPCPACGASLPVDGTKRTMGCEFCHTQAFLPDELWRRFHPVKVIRRWHLWADVGPLRASEARAQAERDAAEARRRADEARRRAADAAAEAERRAMEKAETTRREEQKAQMLRRRWRIALLFAFIGQVLGCALYYFSLLSRNVLPAAVWELTDAFAVTCFFLALCVSFSMLVNTRGFLGRRVRWWHYALPATILLTSLGVLVLWILSLIYKERFSL
jgi:predicted RNA-binding Zn-ribbon protein involved in translation (DUF1610 family)